MDIGDYIYLILALVLGLVSALRKKKAQNDQVEEFEDEEQPQPHSNPNPFDEIFGDIIIKEDQIPYEEEKFETYVEPELQVEPEVEKNQPKVSAYEEYLQQSNQNHESISEKLSVKKEKKERDEKRQLQKKKQSVMSEFDIRKAVIYSEILNRKY